MCRPYRFYKRRTTGPDCVDQPVWNDETPVDAFKCNITENMRVQRNIRKTSWFTADSHCESAQNGKPNASDHCFGLISLKSIQIVKSCSFAILLSFS